MRKILACCFCISIFILTFCSWVDPNTVDVYTGNISFKSSSYDVTRLSGSIKYFFEDTVYLGLDNSGYLYNTSGTTVGGLALINGVEYNIQIPSLGGLQIQQTYNSSGYERSTWVNYNLSPDVIPSAWELPELAIVFIAIIIIIVMCLILFGGYLR